MKYYCEICHKTLSEDEVEIKKLNIKLPEREREKYGQKTVCKTCGREVFEEIKR
jgi:DNA-directed RNA polymerase subunit RPC12/RpoP